MTILSLRKPSYVFFIAVSMQTQFTNSMIYALDKAFPDDKKFKHMEGNSSAHLKSINIGSTLSLTLNDGLIEMGIWQGIFFCEFDGPRERRVLVHIMGE